MCIYLTNIDSLLPLLEDAVRHVFLPALIGRQSFSDEERELFALPARLGGLGIAIPTKYAQRQFSSSSKLSDPLVSLICEGIYSCREAACTEPIDRLYIRLHYACRTAAQPKMRLIT